MTTSVPIIPRPPAIDAPACTMTYVRFLARKAVKRQMQAAGLKLATVEYRAIVRAANEYVVNHPELVAEAIDAVRNIPGLRTLAERSSLPPLSAASQNRRMKLSTIKGALQFLLSSHFVCL